jgi:hypothetical protein
VSIIFPFPVPVVTACSVTGCVVTVGATGGAGYIATIAAALPQAVVLISIEPVPVADVSGRIPTAMPLWVPDGVAVKVHFSMKAGELVATD